MSARTVLPFIITLVLAMALGTPVAGDWVTLKDGIQIHGEVIRETKREVSLRSENGGILTFRMSQVASIHRTSKRNETREKRRVNTDEELPPLPTRGEDKAGVERRFGSSSLRLPEEFTLMFGRGRYPGYVGELLGLYNNEKNGSKVSVTQGPLPFRARSFAEMKNSLDQHLAGESKYQVIVFERREFAAKPTVYAEFREKTPAGTYVHIQAWIHVSAHRIYSVSISTSAAEWMANPYLYRGIVKSFQWAPANSDAPSPAAEVRKG